MSEGKDAKMPEPVAWVIPGDDNEDVNGFLQCRINRDGEFTKPLYGPDLLTFAQAEHAKRLEAEKRVKELEKDAEQERSE